MIIGIKHMKRFDKFSDELDLRGTDFGLINWISKEVGYSNRIWYKTSQHHKFD